MMGITSSATVTSTTSSTANSASFSVEPVGLLITVVLFDSSLGEVGSLSDRLRLPETQLIHVLDISAYGSDNIFKDILPERGFHSKMVK